MFDKLTDKDLITLEEWKKGTIVCPTVWTGDHRNPIGIMRDLKEIPNILILIQQERRRRKIKKIQNG